MQKPGSRDWDRGQEGTRLKQLQMQLRTKLPRSSLPTALGPPTSIINGENALQICPQDSLLDAVLHCVFLFARTHSSLCRVNKN